MANTAHRRQRIPRGHDPAAEIPVGGVVALVQMAGLPLDQLVAFIADVAGEADMQGFGDVGVALREISRRAELLTQQVAELQKPPERRCNHRCSIDCDEED